VFKDYRSSKCNDSIFLAFNGQIKLRFFRLGSCFKDFYVLGLLFSFILDFGFVKLIINLKVSCGYDLENSIPIVFKVENIIVSLIFGFDVSKTFGCKKSKIVIFFLVTLNENSLSKP